MKVLMLISKIEPSENGVIVGGSVNSLLMLAKGLAEVLGKQNIISSMPSCKIPIFDKYLPEYAEFHVVKNNLRPQSVGFGLIFLLKSLIINFRLRSKKTKIVHGHSGYPIYALVTYLLSIINESVSIHTVYCPIQIDGTVDGKKNPVLKGALAAHVLKRLDKIIAMSENIGSSLISVGVSGDLKMYLIRRFENVVLFF